MTSCVHWVGGTSFKKLSPITYRFSKTLENTYEGVQFSEVTGLQSPTLLLKTSSFIDMKQRFQTRIHKNLHSFNLFDNC